MIQMLDLVEGNLIWQRQCRFVFDLVVERYTHTVCSSIERCILSVRVVCRIETACALDLAERRNGSALVTRPAIVTASGYRCSYALKGLITISPLAATTR